MSVEVRVYPRGDAAFEARVAALVRTLDGRRHDPDAVATHLLNVLRSEFPVVRVVIQSSLAVMGETEVVYVYRDGHALDLPRAGPGTMRRLSRPAAAVVRAASLIADAHDLLAVARATRSTSLEAQRRSITRRQIQAAG